MHCLLCVICMQAINSQSRIEVYQCSSRMKSTISSKGQFFTHQHGAMYDTHIVIIIAKTNQQIYTFVLQIKCIKSSHDAIFPQFPPMYVIAIIPFISSSSSSSFCIFILAYLLFWCETFFSLLNLSWILSPIRIILVIWLNCVYTFYMCVACTADPLFIHMNRKFDCSVRSFCSWLDKVKC